MFRKLTLTLALIVASAGAFVVAANPGAAQDMATPAASPMSEMSMTGTGAAFMVIANGGSEDDVLLGGETDVAQVVEVHEMAEVDGVMEMRPLSDGLAIPAGGEETLKPGGYHIMLIGLTEDLTNGMTYDLTLHFEKAGDVTVPVTVRPRAELAADATPTAPVTAGGITISDPWSRPAPATGMAEMEQMATPEATPQA
ncbi:MAG: copper chaperone PCu(A)C [Thermomicrobiales bacterium]